MQLVIVCGLLDNNHTCGCYIAALSKCYFGMTGLLHTNNLNAHDVSMCGA